MQSDFVLWLSFLPPGYMDKGIQPAATGSTAARRRSYAQAFEEEDQSAVDNNPKGKQRELDAGVGENGAAVASAVKDESESELDDEEDESQHCAICLSLIDNQTTVQPCMHGQ